MLDKSAEVKQHPIHWVLKEDYEAYRELIGRITPEQRDKMGYFFWNNLSLDGYEKWKEKQKQNNGE